MATRLETARLVIRSFEGRDRAPWFAMVSEPEFHRFLPPRPAPTIASFATMMDRYRDLESQLHLGVWAIEVRESGTFVGQCGLQPVERTGPEIEIVYHFRQASWGKGFATEAAIAVLAHAFDPLGLDRVIALVAGGNVGSWRVAEKAGMTYVELASYYDMADLKKYEARRSGWHHPRDP